MPPKDPSGSTRRRFLKTLGAGLAATGLSGCVADSGGTGRESAVGFPGNPTQDSLEADEETTASGPYRRIEGGLRWHSTPVPFVVGTSTYPDDLDQDAVNRAITRSFDAWNAVPGTETVFDEPRMDPDLESITFENGVNEIVWEEMPDDALGRAHWRWASGTDRLLEVDVRLNPDREWFVDESEAGDSVYDVQSVLMHELGHNALRDIHHAPRQTMYHETTPGKTGKRTLEDGDIAGWQDAYGTAEGSRESIRVGGFGI